MTLAEKIQYMRKKAGLSQEALAEILGVSRQAVSKWETGEAAPEAGKVFALSRAFGVTADWLLSNEGLPERKLEPEAEEAGGEPENGPAAPNWVESIPGVLGRLLRRWGWLFGVYTAIVGAAFTLFGVLARLLVNGFTRSVSTGFGAMSGWEFGGSFPVDMTPQVSADFGPFSVFGTVFIVLGVVLIVTGGVLAVVLKRKSGRK